MGLSVAKRPLCDKNGDTLIWKCGGSGPLGYGLRDAEVYFPLGRRVGFYGVFEARPKPVVLCKSGHVASMNKRIVENAQRHIFSALPAFSVWHHGRVRWVELKCGGPPLRSIGRAGTCFLTGEPVRRCH